MELFGLMFCGIFLISIIGMIVMIAALVDCVKNEKNDNNNLLVWVLIIVLAGWIGALVYYFVRVPQRNAEKGREPPKWGHQGWR